MKNVKAIYKNAKVIKISDKQYIADNGDFVLIIRSEHDSIQTMVYYKSIHVYTCYKSFNLTEKPLETIEEYLERFSNDNNDNKFSEAIEVIKSEFAKDKSVGSIYHIWQANIAMSIYDDSTLSPEKCNEIAEKFLNRIINGG